MGTALFLDASNGVGTRDFGLGAVDISPSLGMGETQLIGGNANNFPILPVELKPELKSLATKSSEGHRDSAQGQVFGTGKFAERMEIYIVDSFYDNKLDVFGSWSQSAAVFSAFSEEIMKLRNAQIEMQIQLL
jgi:hypothetical protein